MRACVGASVYGSVYAQKSQLCSIPRLFSPPLCLVVKNAFRQAFRFPNALAFEQREMKTYLDGSTYSLIKNGECTQGVG